ncbi:hypothetical protein FHR70_000669 [Microvirga lupini]|uniref:UVR domain-containing protein n=1 Tax=Microvirga lupini TaxID=420324 RepID=A0A7W4YVW8_9HYPH|nr:UvrB/UvrC motif-containing protein [Microvirga lupini]MBB3017629.1 hypothetical protein [Microvirga lupini]
MPQINRQGTVRFGDAALYISEEGLGGSWEERTAWGKKFKREVFARIIQQLNRIGWTVGPWDEADQYKIIANNHRTCSKGEHLHALLDLSGRCIRLEMWQSANTPTRPDHKGRYESNKEAVAPYLLRLEMERTRRRIRDYLCNVFIGYTFEEQSPGRGSRRRGLKPPTAMEYLNGCYSESWHFKGDWQAYRDANSSPGLSSCFNSNRKSADGKLLEHGQPVYFFDRKGRAQTGIAHYNINNMWWVVSGKYAVTNEASFELYVDNPGDLRCKRNKSLRRKRLESELNAAVARMDYRRAEVLRDLIWPPGEPVFCLWHTEHKLYHCAGFSGYAAEQMDAGKFTRAELQGWAKAPNQIVALGKRPD